MIRLTIDRRPIDRAIFWTMGNFSPLLAGSGYPCRKPLIHNTGRNMSRSLIEALENRTLLAADFSLAALSDTQYTVESFPSTFPRQTAWIAANKDAYNFAFFAHQGDMLRRGYSDSQSQNAADALANLDTAGIPYATAIGNHDYDNQFDDLQRHVSSANYTRWFGDARYTQQLTAGTITEYGSSLDQRNHYHVFQAAGQQFLVLSLEWQVPTAAQSWGQSVINNNAQLPVIVITHEYLAGSVGNRTSGTPVDAALLGAQNGQSLWTNFVSLNPQIFMVLSGHTGANWNRVVSNAAGLPVIEAATDFEGVQPNGGDGWMQTIEFTLGATGSVKITNVRPGENGGADQFGASATYNINFDTRFAFAPGTPTTPTPSASPVAADDTLSVDESRQVTTNVLLNDSDTDSSSLKAILTTLPAHGALYVNDNGTFTYTPDPKFVGVDTFTYVASDGDTVSAPATVTVNVGGGAVRYAYASAETTTIGTRTGTFANLAASDNTVETITERISSGLDVDQRWTFNIPVSTADHLLAINAWRSFSNPGTGDEYHLQYSTNGSTWSDLNRLVTASSRDVTRTRFDANQPYQLWTIPSTVSGTVYIRATDVNTSGTETADTLTVDELFIRSVPDLSVPAAPTNLNVVKQTSKVKGKMTSQARLTWTDNAATEAGFYIWSSRDGVNWTKMATLSPLTGTGGSGTYTTSISGGLGSGLWYFKVTSFNANGESASSNIFSITI